MTLDQHFIAVVCHVFCEWEGDPPTYRAYVDDELFTERTWIWKNEYLEELLQIQAPVGKYNIRYELVPPFTGNIYVKTYEIEYGPIGSRFYKGGTLRISHNEST
jgi:hypothetical protein